MAAHGGGAAAGVVVGAALGVELRGAAHHLRPRGHGVGGRVHVTLLLDVAVLFVGQSLCWREKSTNSHSDQCRDKSRKLLKKLNFKLLKSATLLTDLEAD